MSPSKYPPKPPSAESKMELMIAAMLYEERWNTAQDLAHRMAKRMGVAVSASEAGVAMSHLRKHADAYGFTVSHVKRGSPKSGSTDRYMLIAVDKADTSFRFDEESRKHFDEGSRSMMKTIAQQSTNHTHLVATRIQYERVGSRIREMLEEFEAEVAYVARKARKIVKEIDDTKKGGKAA